MQGSLSVARQAIPLINYQKLVSCTFCMLASAEWHANAILWIEANNTNKS